MFKALGIDIVSLVWQIIAFLGLIFVLNMVLFRPIRKTLDERAKRIETSMEEAERIKSQAIRADEAYQERMDEAQRQAQQMAEQAREQARQERERILEQARGEAQQMLADTRTQLEVERRDAARETRRQVAGLAMLAASRLIGENMDTEKNRRLVDQDIATMDRPLNELTQALATVPPERVGNAQVLSAAPLPDATQEELRTRVVQGLGRDVSVSFGVDPKLIGGFVLQVGDQVIDLSVARKVGELFHELVA